MVSSWAGKIGNPFLENPAHFADVWMLSLAQHCRTCHLGFDWPGALTMRSGCWILMIFRIVLSLFTSLAVPHSISWPWSPPSAVAFIWLKYFKTFACDKFLSKFDVGLFQLIELPDVPTGIRTGCDILYRFLVYEKRMASFMRIFAAVEFVGLVRIMGNYHGLTLILPCSTKGGYVICN